MMAILNKYDCLVVCIKRDCTVVGELFGLLLVFFIFSIVIGIIWGVFIYNVAEEERWMSKIMKEN